MTTPLEFAMQLGEGLEVASPAERTAWVPTLPVGTLHLSDTHCVDIEPGHVRLIRDELRRYNRDQDALAAKRGIERPYRRPIRVEHRKDGSSKGRLEDMEVRQGQLYSKLSFGPKAWEKVLDGEYEYVSLKTVVDHLDAQTGERYAVLPEEVSVTDTPRVTTARIQDGMDPARLAELGLALSERTPHPTQGGTTMPTPADDKNTTQTTPATEPASPAGQASPVDATALAVALSEALDFSAITAAAEAMTAAAGTLVETAQQIAAKAGAPEGTPEEEPEEPDAVEVELSELRAKVKTIEGKLKARTAQDTNPTGGGAAPAEPKGNPFDGLALSESIDLLMEQQGIEQRADAVKLHAKLKREGKLGA